MAEAAQSTLLERRPGVLHPELPGFFARSTFASLSHEARLALAKIATVRIYQPNEFIYLQDDEAEYLYFVRSGHVRLSGLMEDGSAVLFGFVPAGEVFGEVGVLDGTTHCDMATAVGTASMVQVPATAFRQLAARHPALEAALGRTVARHYRTYVEITRSLRLKSLEARLAHAVVRLADGMGLVFPHEGRNVAGIGPFVTQADLGLMARGARGNVNRHLKAWERAGLLAFRNRAILMLDREGLLSLTMEDGL